MQQCSVTPLSSANRKTLSVLSHAHGHLVFHSFGAQTIQHGEVRFMLHVKCSCFMAQLAALLMFLSLYQSTDLFFGLMHLYCACQAVMGCRALLLKTLQASWSWWPPQVCHEMSNAVAHAVGSPCPSTQ